MGINRTGFTFVFTPFFWKNKQVDKVNFIYLLGKYSPPEPSSQYPVAGILQLGVPYLVVMQEVQSVPEVQAEQNGIHFFFYKNKFKNNFFFNKYKTKYQFFFFTFSTYIEKSLTPIHLIIKK